MKRMARKSLGVSIFGIVVCAILIYVFLKGYVGDLSSGYTRFELLAVCGIMLGHIINAVKILKARM